MVAKQNEYIGIVDFGGQYTQLIARRIRESNVYCEILMPNVRPADLRKHNLKGIILSGGSAQLRDLQEFFKRSLGVSAYVAEDPILCVAKGTATILNHLDVYKRTLLSKRT